MKTLANLKKDMAQSKNNNCLHIDEGSEESIQNPSPDQSESHDTLHAPRRSSSDISSYAPDHMKPSLHPFAGKTPYPNIDSDSVRDLSAEHTSYQNYDVSDDVIAVQDRAKQGSFSTILVIS